VVINLTRDTGCCARRGHGHKKGGGGAAASKGRGDAEGAGSTSETTPLTGGDAAKVAAINHAMESGVAAGGDGGGLGDGGPVPQVMASGSECSESEAGASQSCLPRFFLLLTFIGPQGTHTVSNEPFHPRKLVWRCDVT